MASCVNAATQRAALAAHPRPAGLRRDDAAGVPAAPGPGRRAARPDPRRALPEPDGAFYAFPDVRAVTHDTREPGRAAPLRPPGGRLAGRGVRPAVGRLPAALLRLLGRGPGRGPDAARGRARRRAARLTRPAGWRSGPPGARPRPYRSSGATGSRSSASPAARPTRSTRGASPPIERALDEAAGGGARGVVLTGYERFFSAGLDLVTLYGLERDAMDGFMARFDAVMLRVFAFPRPVVAAIGGHAVAGGADPRAGLRRAGDGRDAPGGSG